MSAGYVLLQSSGTWSASCSSSAERCLNSCPATLQPLRKMAKEDGRERGESFVSLTKKVQIAVHFVSQMVLTTVFSNGGPQGQGEPATEIPLAWLV